MTNLSSSFDPASIVFSMNWMSSFLELTLIPITFWFISNRFFIINYKIMFNLHKKLKIPTKLNMGTLIYISMFYFILFNNLLMTLLGNTCSLLYFLLTLLIMSKILWIILETAVAMIQSYVFAIMSSLYSSEVNYG